VKSPVQSWSQIRLSKDPVLLLGNGASRAIDNDAFNYTSLLSRAELSSPSKRIFELIGDSDFEKALLRLEITKDTNHALGINEVITKEHIEEIRDGLVTAVRSIHPPQGASISKNTAKAAIGFMSHFKAVFTLNYDFFLYWLIQLSRDLDGVNRVFKDWFTKSGEFDHSWKNGIYEPYQRTPCSACYFLHGALHLIDEPESKLILDDFDSTQNVKLTEKIKKDWERGKRPLFVSEGKSTLKLRRIQSSVYLRHAFEEFKRLIRGHDIVIYGASLSDQDQHLVDAINESKPARAFVGLHNPANSDDTRLVEWSKKITSGQLHFFDASSEGCWIY